MLVLSSQKKGIVWRRVGIAFLYSISEHNTAEYLHYWSNVQLQAGLQGNKILNVGCATLCWERESGGFFRRQSSQTEVRFCSI